MPAAIAAPTPVSALVHSSTLVTAGVYVLVRFYDLVFSVPGLRWYVLHVGVLTSLMAGMRAVCEADLKKVVALSTLSQLGVIMFSLGLGLKDLCVFHLFTHAMFKALIFLCVGSIIHSHNHLQDIRGLGCTWYFIPVSSTCLNVGNLSLCGFPFLSGFYSKDIILEFMISRNLNTAAGVFMFLSTFLTVVYSARLRILRLLGKNNFFTTSKKIEETRSNLFPISLITLGSVFRGPCLFWCIGCRLREP